MPINKLDVHLQTEFKPIVLIYGAILSFLVGKFIHNQVNPFAILLFVALIVLLASTYANKKPIYLIINFVSAFVFLTIGYFV